MMRIVRAGGLVAALVVVGLAIAAPASAQSSSALRYSGASVAVSSATVECGATLQGTGSGWAPGIPVSLTVDSSPLPPVTPDSTGSFTVNFASPASAGSHTLTAVQIVDGTTITKTTTFTCTEADAGSVTNAAPVKPAGALPFTGGNSAPFAQLGIALLAVGALVVLIVRKRRNAGA